MRPTKETKETTHKYIKLLNHAIKVKMSLESLVVDLDNSRRPGGGLSIAERKAKETLKEWEEFIRNT